MKILILSILVFGLHLQTQASSILGSWSGPAAYTTEYGTGGGACSNVSVHLTKNPQNEVRLQVNYDCIWSWDWYSSYDKIFALDTDGNLLGEDGFYKDQEFFWNNAIAWKGGTKIRLTLNPDDTLKFEHEEMPLHGSNTPYMNASLRRISEPKKDQAPIFRDQFNGKWEGTATIHITDKKNGKTLETDQCPVLGWNIKHENSVWNQTHLYLPKCGNLEVNEWIGAFFFEYGKIFQYPTDHSKQLKEVGVYDDKGFQTLVPFPSDESLVQVEILDADHIQLTRTESSYDASTFPHQQSEIKIILDLQRSH